MKSNAPAGAPAPPPKDRCPVSGLPVLSRPEWTDVRLDEGYRATFFFLGESILVGRPAGVATMEGVRKLITLTADIEADGFPAGHRYVRIIDSTDLRGISLRARKYYSDEMKKRLQTRCVVFCGVSPFFKVAVQLADRLHQLPYELKIAHDYPEAVRLARDIVEGEGGRRGDVDPPGGAAPERGEGKEWFLDMEGYSVRYEIIDGDILHVEGKGYLEDGHIDPISRMRGRAVEEMGRSRPLYIVMDGRNVRGGSRKARKRFLSSLLDLHRERTVRMVLLYGANASVRAMAYLSRPFTGIVLRIVHDREAALGVIARDRSAQHSPSGPVDELCEERILELTHHHVDEVLQYLSSLSWDEEGFDSKPPTSPAHPFRPVFEAIDLVKKELDGQFLVRRLAEEQLKAARDDLWVKVAERTADLSVANRRLKEIDGRRRSFLTGMGQEVASSLNAIVGLTDDVLRGEAGQLNEAQGKLIGGAKKGAADLLDLVGDVLDISRLEGGQVQLDIGEFDLANLLREAQRAVAPRCSEYGVTFSAQVPEHLEVRSDEGRVRRVIQNLLRGVARRVGEGDVEISLDCAGDEAVVTIRGKGAGRKDVAPGKGGSAAFPGGDEEDLDLFLVRRMADILGGRIAVRIGAGRGRETLFNIPKD